MSEQITAKQKVALVTGGTRGIGASIVRELAQDGYAVAINYLASAEAAGELALEIKARGGNAIAVKCNVAKFTEVSEMFDAVQRELGPIDVLVNNAGVMELATLKQSSDELFDSQVAINFKGTFNTLKLSAEYIASGGSIINLSTSVVGLKLETYGVYAATKAAVESMSAILAKELRGKSINVNCVAPGPTSTELFLNNKPPAVIEKLAKMPPLERLGEPEDIANVVSFLASPKGNWINGQVLRANGGIV
ncbi:MAG: SDR family oxidoreductase [Paraglaciecola sp.]|uniref:SDR family oxidoreductase n=1 Tax=Paraglaciecola sp. TaxID=1920173 RepID=UPI00326445FF